MLNLVQNPVMKFYDYYEEKHYFFILTSNTFLLLFATEGI